MLDVALIVSIFLAILVITLVYKGLVVVQQSEAIVIERLGSYHKTLEPGVNFIIPFIDKARGIKMCRYRTEHGKNIPIVIYETRIDRRETVLDFPGQSVITTDNVGVVVNGALYFQIIDPNRAVYQAENLIQAVEILAKTSLRSEIGRMELDKLFESRKEINQALQIVMDEAGNKWGIKVTRVEIQDIVIPSEVEEAMRKQMAAERERRAVVRQALGEKEAAIARAEGEKQSTILMAEGEKESAILRAQGQQEAIEKLMHTGGASIESQNIMQYLLGLEYLKTLPNIAKAGDKVLLPYESSAVLSSLASIKEIFK